MNYKLFSICFGIVLVFTGCDVSDFSLFDPPASLKIISTTPNPFKDSLTVMYSVGSADRFSQLSIVITDRSKRDVAIIVDTIPVNGIHTAHWNGKDINDNAVNGGFYFVELRGWYSSGEPVGKIMIFKEE